MSSSRRHEEFVQLMIRSQSRLYAYILSLVADRAAADDVLQETNLRLLRQEAEFTPESDFLAWAISVANYQVLTSRKQRQRERLRFDDELISILADEARQRSALLDDRLTALRGCLAGLDAEQRQMIESRTAGVSVQQLAEETARPSGSVSQALYRIRKFLAECVRRKLAAEGGEP